MNKLTKYILFIAAVVYIATPEFMIGNFVKAAEHAHEEAVKKTEAAHNHKEGEVCPDAAKAAEKPAVKDAHAGETASTKETEAEHAREESAKKAETAHNHKEGETCPDTTKIAEKSSAVKKDEHAGEAAEAEIKIDGLQEEPVKIETVYETVKSNGTVKFHPEHYAKVAALVPGKLKQMKVKLGDRVKKGQEIAVIESIDIFNAKVEYLKNLNKYEVMLSKYENIVKMGELGSFTQKNVEEAKSALSDSKSQHDKSQIALSTAQKKYERIKKLFDSGISSRSELEAADNELKSAAIEYESSKSKLDNIEKSLSRVEKLSDSKISLKKEVGDIQTEFFEARQNFDVSQKYLAMVGVECDPNTGCKIHELGTFSIYSPIDGMVIEQLAAIGASIDTQNPVMCIGDYDKVIADIDIYENDCQKVSAGQTVEIESAMKIPVIGNIIYISNQLEPNTRTLKARAEISENAELLKIGEFINCEILVSERPNAVTIPQKALVEDGDRQLVFVKCGKTYDKTYVKTGYRFMDKVEIKEGLAAGNIVVTVGNQQLFNMALSSKLELSCDSCK